MSKRQTRTRGDNLRALKGKLREEDISYRALAAKLCCSPTSLSNKINGIAVFDVAEIQKICNIVNIEPDDIITYFFPSMLLNSNLRQTKFR